jgi:hypothetical protein
MRRDFGTGLIVRSHNATKINPNGRCQLTRIMPDHTQNSVMLAIKWHRQNAKIIKSQIYQIIQFHNQYGGKLQDCICAIDNMESSFIPADVF